MSGKTLHKAKMRQLQNSSGPQRVLIVTMFCDQESPDEKGRNHSYTFDDDRVNCNGCLQEWGLVLLGDLS